MQNTAAVTVYECVQQGDTDPGDFSLTQSALLGDDCRQRASGDQVHDDPLCAVVLDQAVDGDHVGVDAESCGVTCFTVGTFDQQLTVVGRDVVRDPDLLEGAFGTGTGVICPPDRSHTARAEALDEAVPPADHPRGGVPA